jgi:hypothetical protein
MSAVNRVKVLGDRMSHILLRGCWSDITVLNVHDATEDKSEEPKDSFFE